VLKPVRRALVGAALGLALAVAACSPTEVDEPIITPIPPVDPNIPSTPDAPDADPAAPDHTPELTPLPQDY
jgi:hypothetical protein